MNVKSFLNLHISEQENSKNRVNEQEEEQESSHVNQLRKGIYERIEQDAQILELFYHFDYSYNA